MSRSQAYLLTPPLSRFLVICALAAMFPFAVPIYALAALTEPGTAILAFVLAPVAGLWAGWLTLRFGQFGGHFEVDSLSARLDGRKIHTLLNHGTDWVEVLTEDRYAVRWGTPAQVGQLVGALEAVVPAPSATVELDGVALECAPHEPLLDGPTAILWALFCVAVGALPGLGVLAVGDVFAAFFAAVLVFAVALPLVAIGAQGTAAWRGLPRIRLELRGHTLRLVRNGREETLVLRGPGDVRTRPHGAGVQLWLAGRSIVVTRPFADQVLPHLEQLSTLEGDADAVPEALQRARRVAEEPPHG